MKNRDTITFGLCGDVMIGRLVDESGAAIWGDLLPLLHSTDFTLANLEAALTHSKKIVPKVFNFKSDPKHVAWLKEAKFDIVNLANNHVLDYDVEGLLETLKTLDRANILHVGAGIDSAGAKKAVIVAKHGIKVGVIGFSDNEPGWKALQNRPGIHYVDIDDYDEVVDQVIELKKKADIVIVSQHIGPNMVARPDRQKRKLCRALIDAGADIVHSHSAHIFQGVERYKKGVILYDAGDFVDDYYVDPGLRNDRSFFFMVELTKVGPIKLTLVPTLISNLQVNLAPLDEAEAAMDRMELLSKEFDTHFTRTSQGLVAIF